jgi:monoamine oxidase
VTTFRARIAIVGGGLAGLVAAWRLVQQGVRDIVLLEARTTLGGRILSVDATGSLVDMTESALDRFDLGPSWFWPALQPQLDQLVTELGVHRFAQVEDGDLLVERSAQTPPLRTQAHPSEPPSMRLVGGVAAHINPPLSDREDAVLGGHRVASTAAGSSIRLWIA